MLIKKVERANQESEKLAMLVEKHRFDEARAAYVHRKEQTRPFGLAGWILGWHKHDDDDEELEELREAAKSTLLNALKTEQNHVEELEASVSVLEQNNTVIALQVQSRDKSIEELNERVAVFEENKVVPFNSCVKICLRRHQIWRKLIWKLSASKVRWSPWPMIKSKRWSR